MKVQNYGIKNPQDNKRDSGYRGEVGVLVHNLSNEVIEIECGERIAQGVICPVYQANFIDVYDLDETERGDGAYNSTGVK